MKSKFQIGRSLLRLLLFCFLTGSIFGQKIPLPKEPSLPNEPGLDARGDSPNSSSNNQNAGPNVKAYFCDGRTITGIWRLAPKEFSFKHVRENVQYSKTLKFEDISRVLLKAWKLIPGKPNTQGTPYKAEPWEIHYKTKSGETFERIGELKKDFSELKIQNELGEANLFFYWIDLMFENKTWFSKLPKIEGDIRKECHPDVIVGIEFL
ncbi:hypothetical protein [Leptospira sarikeiensis]|uniref:Uncharacterized protein n=1 Tax=Leptospira sarikeiensis TaxID=2484943 RepID=A0A4R9K839_9LEPT|nr:hypothetical protein [Leptospira sarikeiensis]TGL60855.1 hypothetical protein EHQ64_13680 [Leptospira sarikeiensis]